jgi:diguanylate cyclase (GGDEF)-like protein
MKDFAGVTRFFAESDSPEQSALRSVSSFMLPDSLATWSCATLLCFLASWGGLLLARTPAQVDVLWPANGIMLAFLLVRPPRYWVSYVAGAIAASLAVHWILGFQISQSWIFTAANTVELVMAAVWLTPEDRTHSPEPDLTNPRALAAFVFYGVLLAPLASTAVVELILIGLGTPAQILALSNYFIGDAMGIAMMTPLVLAVHVREVRLLFAAKKRWETVGILAGLTLLAIAVFSQNGLPLVFLLFPALLLSIFRLGISGSAIGIFLMAVPAAFLTVQRRGPFSPGLVTNNNQIVHSIFSLQCFLGICLVTIYSVASALAERDRAQKEMTEAFEVEQTAAATDHTTGLANRRTFDRELARQWRRALREHGNLSLLMIDVDQFKLYNDYYGHVAGDACLLAVAKVLMKAPLRESDLIARYGGEEFAVILPRANADGASRIGELIRQSVADAALPHFARVPGIVTVSIGVATFHPTAEMNEAGLNESELIQRADSALYIAKGAGRNQIRIWQETATGEDPNAGPNANLKIN